MDENLLSVFKKELGYVNATNQYVVVLVKWNCNGIVHAEHLEFGCSYQQEDGSTGYPWKNNGNWVLIPWKIQGLYK